MRFEKQLYLDPMLCFGHKKIHTIIRLILATLRVEHFGCLKLHLRTHFQPPTAAIACEIL